MAIERKLLFGGDLKWNANDWRASDDRVRGGKSQSHLTPLPSPSDPHLTNQTAKFHGTLDITTLGSAGFASQRTSSTLPTWDLRPYSGLNLVITDGDEKTYTFTLKDDLLEPDPESGREKATLNWEVDFCVAKEKKEEGGGEEEETEEEEAKEIFVPWQNFKPTYRGKEKRTVKPLDLMRVSRMSLMMRSFFGTQEGDFSLTLRSIEAVTVEEQEAADGGAAATKQMHQRGGNDSENSMVEGSDREGVESQAHPRRQSWRQWIWGRGWKL